MMIYMKIDGIPGGVTWAPYAGWIETSVVEWIRPKKFLRGDATEVVLNATVEFGEHSEKLQLWHSSGRRKAYVDIRGVEYPLVKRWIYLQDVRVTWYLVTREPGFPVRHYETITFWATKGSVRTTAT